MTVEKKREYFENYFAINKKLDKLDTKVTICEGNGDKAFEATKELDLSEYSKFKRKFQEHQETMKELNEVLAKYKEKITQVTQLTTILEEFKKEKEQMETDFNNVRETTEVAYDNLASRVDEEVTKYKNVTFQAFMNIQNDNSVIGGFEKLNRK